MTKENENEEVFENNEITITTAGGGKAKELFLRELKAVIENIYDEATPESKSRSIGINFTVTPVIDNMVAGGREDRVKGYAISVKSGSTLCKAESNAHVSYAGLSPEGMPIAVEKDPHQMNIFEQSMKKKQELEEEDA